MRECKEPCIFYLYLQSKINERAIGGIITIKEATNYLHEWRIPSCMRIAIIKEMESLGLLKRIDRMNFRIKKLSINFNNISEVYEHSGVLSFKD
jgi:hypothetical protein